MWWPRETETERSQNTEFRIQKLGKRRDRDRERNRTDKTWIDTETEID
jgi:hypothetical protein